LRDDIGKLLKVRGRIGLDIGSRSAKMYLREEGDFFIWDTPVFLEELSLVELKGCEDIVSTGYGRLRVPGARTIPEIRAHTTGVVNSLDIEDCTILDIGGQDFKIIRIEGRGIKEFIMNDKCAAGTGRFLEKMADMLSMDLEELGNFIGGRKVLESTCSVFTETEIISLMMDGVPRSELACGVLHSVYERVRPSLRMFPMDLIVFTGGVSRMKGLVSTISEELDVEVIVPERSQFMGAYGCAMARSGRGSNRGKYL
jgi:predicted CoA-substrate-specific enzyme activase